MKAFKSACKKRKNAVVATMLDLMGPIVLIDKLEKPEIELEKGQSLEISRSQVLGNSSKISISYPAVLNRLVAGQTVYLSDRSILAEIEEIEEESVHLIIRNDGVISSNSDILFVGSDSHSPVLTEKDEEDLIKFGLKEGIDFVCISFCQTCQLIESVRDLLGPKGAHIKIIAKIEDSNGIANIDSMLKEADGILIGRGDLGVEVGAKKLMTAQKFLVERANLAGKPVITANQLLHSMIDAPFPTRAEISDVSNAVYDGSSGLTLGSETFMGEFPVECVKTMADLCLEAEQCINYEASFKRVKATLSRPIGAYEALYCTSVSLAMAVRAKVIICITEDGQACNYISKFKPRQPILALCMSASVVRQMNICSGVIALKIPSYIGTDNLIKDGLSYALERKLVSKGNNVVVILGRNNDSFKESQLIKVIVA